MTFLFFYYLFSLSKSLSTLKNNQYLKHIDASDNSISDFCDLTALTELQVTRFSL
jgi:hypothetical protein